MSKFDKYNKKRAVKRASFNLEIEDDKELFEYANKIVFSEWVKRKLREELNLRNEC